MTRQRKRPISVADRHRAWLELVSVEGPFLSLPVIKRVWPDGVPAMDPGPAAALRDAKPAFEQAWDKWDQNRDDEGALDNYREAARDWTETILRDVFGWKQNYTTDPTTPVIAETRAHSLDRKVTVAPSGALVHGDKVGALTLVVDPVDSLRSGLGDDWEATAIDRMSDLLREAGVPIGVVTDGRWWAIVCAQGENSTASGISDAQTWIEEPLVCNAFAAMLSRRRLLGGKPEDRLGQLFADSVDDAAEITEALGIQVRQAVELLVQSFSESALEAVAAGEENPLPDDRSQVYEAAVTVMMRVVFLLFAEERGLLPENDLFAAGYGLADRLDVLEERGRDEDIESLGATFLTWHRLLATSQALYQGAAFDELVLPAYGGSLFDPTRYPFLTAQDDHGLMMQVSDRVMLEVLRAVKRPQIKGEVRPISFRDIDVEQIGYIYEGLLGYTTVEVEEVTLGLKGSAGEEPEMPLSVLEDLAERHRDQAKLADAIIKWVKEDQPAAKTPTKAALGKALKAEVPDAELAVRTVTNDPDLQEKLKPFLGVIRRDLRDRPHVVLRGGVVVIETASRANAGAHYTPRPLAEEVVRYALEPLVYRPGPHQEPDPAKWRRIQSYEILELKVADIACGSGAFLVAAARYLADQLVQAWKEERVAFGSAEELKSKAIRQVVARCLYGADINPMAVEMCKLSLWLVSLDPKLPFSFVDDKIFCGNSLLGITDIRQLEELNMHLPEDGHQDTMFDAVGNEFVNRLDMRRKIERVKQVRGQLASEVDDNDPQRSAATKRHLVREQEELTAKLVDVADGIIAAGLKIGGKSGRAWDEAYENLRIAVGLAYPEGGVEPDRTMLDNILEAGLTPTVATDYMRWQPLHWGLAVPDLMDRGGFDAIVGNPPYLGGYDLANAVGANLRSWLINMLAAGTTGSADLAAYFMLRAASLLHRGNVGYITTDTIAQGDTREVGLDQLAAQGFEIYRSVQSRRWPTSTVTLKYAAVWGTVGSVDPSSPRIADGVRTRKIQTLLEPEGKIAGLPKPLLENHRIAFKGCSLRGTGFVVDEETARMWLDADPRNAEVVIPYLNGAELNSLASLLPVRRVVDFTGLSEDEAAEFTRPFAHVEREVRQDRQKLKGKLRDEWWLFESTRPSLRRAIEGLSSVIAWTQTSATQVPAMIPADCVYDQKLVVFASDSDALFAVLSSSIHRLWATKYGLTRTGDPVYTSSAVFEPFPRPKSTEALDRIGSELQTERGEVMLRRKLGLTKLYNLVNDPDVTSDPDMLRLREIHADLDQIVMDAYGWSDVPLDHGFHTYRQMTRWTVSPEARVEIFDRLLAENHRRAAAQSDAQPADDDESEDDE